MIEGYSLLFFSVYLVGTARHIRIYSIDDAKETIEVYGAITGFLYEAENRHNSSKPDNI